MSTEWEIIPEKTDRLWLEVKEPDGWYTAICKWDGCVHFYRYHNVPYPQPEDDKMALDDYIHYCSLDEEIERLTKLRDKAREFFEDEEWGS